jgi:hypothetical protein
VLRGGERWVWAGDCGRSSKVFVRGARGAAWLIGGIWVGTLRTHRGRGVSSGIRGSSSGRANRVHDRSTVGIPESEGCRLPLSSIGRGTGGSSWDGRGGVLASGLCDIAEKIAQLGLDESESIALKGGDSGVDGGFVFDQERVNVGLVYVGGALKRR